MPSNKEQKTRRSLSLKGLPRSKWWGSFRRSVRYNSKKKKWMTTALSTPPRQVATTKPPPSGSGDEMGNPSASGSSPRDVRDFPAAEVDIKDSNDNQPIIILVVVDPNTTKFELLRIKVDGDRDDEEKKEEDGVTTDDDDNNDNTKTNNSKKKNKQQQLTKKAERKKQQQKLEEQRQMVTIHDILRLNIISKYSKNVDLQQLDYESICDFTTGSIISSTTKLYDLVSMSSTMMMGFGVGVGGSVGGGDGKKPAKDNKDVVEELSLPLFTTITPQSLMRAQEEYEKELAEQEAKGKSNHNNNDGRDPRSFDVSSMDSSSVYTSDNHGNIILVAVPTNSAPEDCALLARRIMTHQKIVNSLERRGIDTSALLTWDSYSDDGNSSLEHDTDDDEGSVRSIGNFSFMSNHSKSSLVRNLFQQQDDDHQGLWYDSSNDTDSEDFFVENVDMVKNTVNCFSDSSHDGSAAQLSSSSPRVGPQQEGYDDEVGIDYDYANEQGEDGEAEEDDDLEQHHPSYLPSMFDSGFGESVEV